MHFARRLAPAALCAVLALLPSAAATETPRLVVVIVVDQLRPERIHAGLPGGLGRLVREGRSYANAVHDHAMTETCPGHAAIATGRHPAHAGIPGNRFFDPSGAVVYCVSDVSPDALELGGGQSVSPRSLRATALGDWLRTARPASRVFSVSGKDRAAIMMGGRQPNAAYWLKQGPGASFTTSRYYRDVLPEWVERFNGSDAPRDGFWAALPERWEHDAAGNGTRPDDFPGESTQFSRTSGHPLRAPKRETFAQRLMATPYLDEVTLDFAWELVEAEGLGGGPGPDLLALSLSATDIVGHLYGPGSQEARDALLRLDAALGRFLERLEARFGRGGLLVALTADHGVLPLPEAMAAAGDDPCPAAAARTGVRRLGLGLLWKLHRRFSLLSWPEAWVEFAGSQVAVNRQRAEAQGKSVAEVAAEAEAYLEAQPSIARVWNPTELRTGTDEFARLYRNSYDPARSGDLVVQLERGCLISSHEAGTTHGTPYLYDRAVPLVFWGNGIAPGLRRESALSVDLAPTLARRLGVEAPRNLDGRVLFE